jgi:hypothetical protein
MRWRERKQRASDATKNDISLTLKRSKTNLGVTFATRVATKSWASAEGRKAAHPHSPDSEQAGPEDGRARWPRMAWRQRPNGVSSAVPDRRPGVEERFFYSGRSRRILGPKGEFPEIGVRWASHQRQRAPNGREAG